MDIPKTLRQWRADAKNQYLADLRRRYEDGLSTVVLGKVYGVSQTTIAEHLKEAGAVMRTNADAQALAFAKRVTLRLAESKGVG